MLILSRSHVESLLSMEEAIAAVEEGFRQLALGQVTMPQRAATPVEPHQGLHLSMPAYVGGPVDALSVKLVTVYPENPARFGLPTSQGVILLHDAHTGQILALVDAEHLTAMRTGAASGVATRYLARQDARHVAIFGAGPQAAAQLEAMCAVRPIERAFVITRTGRRNAAFCTRMARRLGIEVLPCHDARAAVESADIICTATNSAIPLFNGNWLVGGTHINAVGAYTTAMRELDTTTVRRSRVFVDHHPAAQAEAGDIMIPVANGEIGYDHVAGELGDVLLGRVPGRTGDDAITLFKSVGLAVQDAVTVARVYQIALAQGVGQDIFL